MKSSSSPAAHGSPRSTADGRGHWRERGATQQAAAFLNVSRPFVIKEIEAGRLQCRLVNRHRRIEFEELIRYQVRQKQRSEEALAKLSKLSQDMGEEL